MLKIEKFCYHVLPDTREKPCQNCLDKPKKDIKLKERKIKKGA